MEYSCIISFNSRPMILDRTKRKKTQEQKVELICIQWSLVFLGNTRIGFIILRMLCSFEWMTFQTCWQSTSSFHQTEEQLNNLHFYGKKKIAVWVCISFQSGLRLPTVQKLICKPILMIYAL